MYNGYDRDNLGSAANKPPGVGGKQPPTPDSPDFAEAWFFGGPHSGGWQVAFCDGSVHFISFDIDIVSHSRLANRQDGEVIDKSSL
jgi:prepilin-type processing-associated H-X9-DG protein